jgi:DNA-binding winged helix-turn-helix (wHTH) protein
VISTARPDSGTGTAGAWACACGGTAAVAVALTAIGNSLDAASPRDFAGKNDNPVTQLLGQAEIGLSPKEFSILETFMRRPGEVLTRFQLLEHAWDYDYENRSNVVDVYVRYLREKVDRPFGVESIETVRGSGYRIRADGGRIAVAGNSVGGNMTAALSLMAKHRSGPKIGYQILLIPATDATGLSTSKDS